MSFYETHGGELSELSELSDEKQTLSESSEKVADLQFQKEVIRVKQSPDVYDRDQRATVGVSTRGLEAYETEEEDRVLVIEDENKEVTRTEITYDSTETTPEKVLEAYTGGGGGGGGGTLVVVISVVFVLVIIGALVYYMKRRGGGEMHGSISYPVESRFANLRPTPPPEPNSPHDIHIGKGKGGKYGYGFKKNGPPKKKNVKGKKNTGQAGGSVKKKNGQQKAGR